MKVFIKRLALSLVLLSHGLLIEAHNGGWDKQGGHTNRTTGVYHCHRADCIGPNKTVPKSTNHQAYSRESWKHWSDFDGNCMNTRHEILKEQSLRPARLSKNRCYVSSGLWADPYSGKEYTQPSNLDIDHIIPLKWAHDHGGFSWTADKKEAFANDPDNLLAVEDRLNRIKIAQGPTEWLPPNHGYRCAYLDHWNRLLGKYSSLKMTSAEHRIFMRQLSACNIK
jgi:hypothetical protein